MPPRLTDQDEGVPWPYDQTRGVAVDPFDLVVINGDVVLPGGQRRLNVGVRDERIAAISSDPLDGVETLDVSGLAVLPGLIDEHFHVWWGYGFETHLAGSRAAVRGGITTVVEMPLDEPVTLTAEALEKKLATAGSEYVTDYAMYGGYLPENPDEMAAMHDAGVAAFKLFTGAVAPPGMYPGVTPGETYDAMQRARSLDCPVVVHAESESIVEIESNRLQRAGRMDPGAWDEATTLVQRTRGGPVRRVDERVDRVPDGDRARSVAAGHQRRSAASAARAPRSGRSRVRTSSAWPRRTWSETRGSNGILRRGHAPQSTRCGTCSVRATSTASAPIMRHCRRPRTQTSGRRTPGSATAWRRCSRCSRPKLFTTRDVPLTRLVELFCTNPARIFGLYPRKGAITVGADADFTIVELNGNRTLDSRELEWHNPRELVAV